MYMTQKEFEERIQNENLKMKHFNLEIGSLLNEINILGIYNSNGSWKIYETDDRDSTPLYLEETPDENEAFDSLYEYVKIQIKKENL